RHHRVLMFRDGGKRSFHDVEAFVELLVADHQRHQNAHDVVVCARDDGDEPMLEAIVRDLLGFGFGWLASFRVANQFDGAHAAEGAPVTAAIGMPPPSDFDVVIKSGSIPKCSDANHLPVRAIPDWTSSAIKTIPCMRQTA